MAELKPLIVLVATVRSGTTMTAACFNQHDEIAVLREQRMLWTEGNQHLGHDRFTEEQVTPKIAKRIRREFLNLQEERGGRRIFEKTPSNCLRVPFIHKIFPDALIIHMTRNGRDNVSSCLPFWTRPRKQRRIVRRVKETPIHHWPLLLPRLVRDQIGVRLGLTKRVKSWGVIYPGMFDDLQSRELVEVIATQWRTAVETASNDLREHLGQQPTPDQQERRREQPERDGVDARERHVVGVDEDGKEVVRDAREHRHHEEEDLPADDRRQPGYGLEPRPADQRAPLAALRAGCRRPHGAHARASRLTPAGTGTRRAGPAASGRRPCCGACR